MAKTCFTAFAVFPSNSSGARTVSSAPEARKHTSIAKRIAQSQAAGSRLYRLYGMWDQLPQHFTTRQERDMWFRCFASIMFDHWPTKAVPNWKMCVWIYTGRWHLQDSSCGRSILEQNSASLLNKKKDWISAIISYTWSNTCTYLQQKNLSSGIVSICIYIYHISTYSYTR